MTILFKSWTRFILKYLEDTIRKEMRKHGEKKYIHQNIQKKVTDLVWDRSRFLFLRLCMASSNADVPGWRNLELKKGGNY